jgi:transcriptional regulator with PAS, ATPase and Fis domain
VANKKGLFEIAHGGTVFLDEIGDLSQFIQVKLLRVVQEREFMRVGETETVSVDVRLISATNRDLEQEIIQGRFREDLYVRLNVFPITIPPLRQRTEGIPHLVKFFVDKFSKRHGKPIKNEGIASRRFTRH